MTRTAFLPARRALALLTLALTGPAWAQAPAGGRPADFIVAVVNSELVTQFEVEQRMAQAQQRAGAARVELPPPAQLRREVIEALINERVLTTYARDSGQRVDDPELDRAVANVAAANKLSVPALRERLAAEGLDYARFRANLRDQLLAERVREREVQARIKVTDAEIDELIAQERSRQGAAAELKLAQILVRVPEGAGLAEMVERQARAQAALRRALAGEAFDQLAREFSDDDSRERGGDIGVKPADRWPDLFMAAVQPLSPGAVAPSLVRSGAGFHILKLVARQDASIKTTQTRARHILLRPSVKLSADAARGRLLEFKQQVESGKAGFEALARMHSEDGSAANGGDLGWTASGAFVPEFEEAMNRLAIGGISPPVESRFGWHLIQVVERREVPVDPKQLREQATNVLKERKYEAEYTSWLSELRDRAYVEMREPPQ